MADLGSKKISSNYQTLLQISSSGEIADASGSGFGIFVGDWNGSVSGSGTSTGSFAQLVIGNGGDILLDEDQRIYFEEDKQTWVEANGANLFRVVAGNSQMLLLDQQTGNRAVFGNGTKVYIGNDNNALPSETLQVDGNISSSGAIHTLSHITASGNISASGTGHILNLPTSDPEVVGALWASGSTGGSDSSKILVVSQG